VLGAGLLALGIAGVVLARRRRKGGGGGGDAPGETSKAALLLDGEAAGGSSGLSSSSGAAIEMETQPGPPGRVETQPGVWKLVQPHHSSVNGGGEGERPAGAAPLAEPS
jgi:hypothetical protein